MNMPRSTYYERPAAALDDAQIVAAIIAITDEFELYGYRRVTAELRRWDQVVAHPGSDDAEAALSELVVAGVRAAVVAPEREVRRWFTWPVAAGVIERLVDEGRLVRIGDAVGVPD